VGRGGACILNDGCTGDLVCIGDVCTDRSAVGGPCSTEPWPDDLDCPPEAYCSESPAACVAREAPGFRCNPENDPCRGLCVDGAGVPVCVDVCDGA
jgi:hypothetical protein